ncbi:LOW QUALITY PROTEIN: hypothetical protein CRUP_028848 [Coryphaenoides rupestris]|nr:LOW QUALITY PROTEIN: hypothetical protein CRUP_028848 [Coryphaenoides rupestris]
MPLIATRSKPPQSAVSSQPIVAGYNEPIRSLTSGLFRPRFQPAGSSPVADSEILNTAVLTGRTVAVPIKVVSVGTDGTVTDVSEEVRCRSTDEDVVKVSDRCDYVFVNGKEMRGKLGMLVNFTYSYLSAQLELNVWIPRLPLQIELSDTELSQIKSWRVPIVASRQRSARDSDDEDDEDRRGRSCTLQYQNAMVRVLTQFVAEVPDMRGQTSFMLGSDWQVDITELIHDFLKVEHSHIAQLLDGRILMGLDVGMTAIQVLSPLSDSILAEKTITVVDDKVTITELGVQMVTGLSMALQLSQGSNRAILATTTSQEVLHNPKQVREAHWPPTPHLFSGRTSARDSDDEDDEDRRGRSCTLQYQNAMVRVLTQFVAEVPDMRGQTSFMLGSDWQVDITELIHDFLKVEHSHIAQLLDGRILMGLDVGMTAIQVLSPLSDSILAEKTITVVDDKMVTGLSMALQLSQGSNRAILATTTSQEVLHNPKQEAVISAWLQFSDGSTAPLDLYNQDFFVLTATSLDEEVVSVRQDPSWKWPIIVSEAEGQGLLVRVEMTVCELCQKYKRRSILAAGNCNIRVRFGPSDSSRGGASDYSPDGDEVLETRARLSPSQDRTGLDTHYYGSSISDIEDGIIKRATTTKSVIMRRPAGDKLSDDGGQNGPMDFLRLPLDLPRGRNLDDELMQSHRGLTDLEIGMYALLGVFCLAILVFLINCISYTLKYRHKELSVEGQENMNHAHDWVWLGNEAELLESQVSLSPQREEHTSMMDCSSGLEEGSHLLNGGSAQKNVQGQVHRAADQGCPAKDSKGDSPTTKRKRVKFTTFTTTIPPDSSYPIVSTLSAGHGQDIKWVCQDMELGDSKELRNYMERLNDSAHKEV